MARTLADYLDIAEHAAGGQVDASIDLTQIVNDAGRYLVQMHDWAFLERPQALLDTVADQAYLDLPSDFDRLIAVGNTVNNDQYAVKLLPADQFERARTSEVTDQLDIFLSLEWPTQAATTSNSPVPRLAIYPVPATSTSDRYWLNYRAGWTALSANASVANIPEPIEHLLIQLIRAMVRGEVSGQGAYDELNRIEASPALRRLKESYGLVNAEPAPMEGGAIQTLSTNRDWRRHSTITSMP